MKEQKIELEVRMQHLSVQMEESKEQPAAQISVSPARNLSSAVKRAKDRAEKNKSKLGVRDIVMSNGF